jgi:hypothetical protein
MPPQIKGEKPLVTSYDRQDIAKAEFYSPAATRGDLSATSFILSIIVKKLSSLK